MYIPRKFRITELSEMHKFIQNNGFAPLISCGENCQINATHMPFIIDKNEGELGTLYGHFAKANRHWKSLFKSAELMEKEPLSEHTNNNIMAIFTGPHSYISPTWYLTCPAVPTWNYTAVHVFGDAIALDEKQSIDMLMTMSNFYEPTLKDRQDVLNEEITLKLLPAIVAFKLVITHIEGVEKLGQHKPTQDQRGVYENLKQSIDNNENRLAKYMENKNLGIGEE